MEGIFLWRKRANIPDVYRRFKLNAVRAYVKGTSSYKVIAEREGIRNCSQLKVWVKKWKNGEAFDERKRNVTNPLKGRPRTAFGSVEKERDYLQAQVDYLKKRYPNLVKEKRPTNVRTTTS